MTIPNGFIKIISTSAGGFLNGIPQKAETTTSDFIEANVNEDSRAHGQLGDETTGTRSAYTIVIDPADDPAISDRDRVEVFDSRKISLVVFEIQSARLLDYVDAIRIKV